MTKKIKAIVPARKSLLEKTEPEKFKTVSARVPSHINDDFDKLVERAKQYGFTITMSKVIVTALQDAIVFENLELDKLGESNVFNNSTEYIKSDKSVGIKLCKCGDKMIEKICSTGENVGKKYFACIKSTKNNKSDHDFEWIKE